MYIKLNILKDGLYVGIQRWPYFTRPCSLSYCTYHTACQFIKLRKPYISSLIVSCVKYDTCVDCLFVCDCRLHCISTSKTLLFLNLWQFTSSFSNSQTCFSASFTAGAVLTQGLVLWKMRVQRFMKRKKGDSNSSCQCIRLAKTI